jgi:hypothetical protein
MQNATRFDIWVLLFISAIKAHLRLVGDNALFSGIENSVIY